MNRAFFSRLSFAIAVGAMAVTARARIERAEVNHDYVSALARELAAQPYASKERKLPGFLRNLTYDDYRKIRFLPEEALWGSDDTPFKVHFFHPGGLHQNAVTIHEFTDGYSQRIPFVRSFFDYQDLKVPWRLPGDLEYAGFKILYPLNEPTKLDELIAFLGASYFRALGKGHRYGLSARGLAINAGGPAAEEFPAFTEFWLRKPGSADRTLTLHALLDSPSVAGAYTFTITPGTDTETDIRATLYFRTQPEVVGYAPMTSMFWYAENGTCQFGDYRPEVHDSDGLLVANGRLQRLWRPLENPAGVRITDIEARDLKGFGLMQRDRDFESYQDTEAHYHDRPSLWMEPEGNWPAGVVRLVELPSGNEYQDNIVAYWKPSHPPPLGQPVDLQWRLGWTSSGRIGGPAGTVVAVRRSTHNAGEGKTSYFVDFSLSGFGNIPDDAEIVPDVELPDTVAAEHIAVQELPDGERWRLVLHLATTDKTRTSDIRARLLLGGVPISETVLLTWTP